MGPTEVFVSRYARVLTGATWAVALIVVGGFSTAADRHQLALAASASALAALAAWALFWRPRVEVSDGGVLLVNVLRTVEVPWPLLDEARAGWSLEVHTSTGRWTAWAAPRSSGTTRAIRRAPRGRSEAADLAAGPGAEASAEAVAAAIGRRHSALLAAGHLDGARRRAELAGLRETVTWHRGTIAAALALAALTAVLATG